MALKLVANVEVGLALGVGLVAWSSAILVRGTIHHPQASAGALVTTKLFSNGIQWCS